MKHAALTTAFNNADAVYANAQTHTVTSTRIASLDLNLVDATAPDTIRALLAPGRRRAFFMNAHCCNMRRQNRTYSDALSRADFLLPDGIGVELAARMSDQTLSTNLNGTDLVPQLLCDAARMGKSVFLFGAAPGTADAAAMHLIHTIPNLRVAGTRDGYEGATHSEAVIADINDSGADIVLVGLGVPMQEIWLDQHAHRLNADLTMAVGALFDFLAGTVQRAPSIVRRARMEWVWRLAQEPRRLAKRYLAGNLTFLAHAGLTTWRLTSAADRQRRALDVGVAMLALVLLAPVLMATALAIRIESRGPIVFRQTRIGRNGVPFTMYKFRSMRVNAEQLQASLAGQSDREGVCFKAKKDPRITAVGRFIRRSSIDELPQIVNVLRGEMAIVGPRPALPVEVAAYSRHALGRLCVKPGITGVWQVSGRANIAFDQMIDMDLDYAANRSVWLDISLIMRTFSAVLTGRGAY